MAEGGATLPQGYGHSRLSRQPDKVVLSATQFWRYAFRPEKIQEAEKLLLSAYQIAQDQQQPDPQKDISLSLSNHYERTGHTDKALRYRKTYDLLLDSLFTDELATQFARLNVKYETEKKERMLAEQTADISQLEAERLSERNQRNLWIAAAVLLLLLTLYVVFSFRSRQRMAKLKLAAGPNRHSFAGRKASSTDN